jgi:hypothetical protein
MQKLLWVGSIVSNGGFARVSRELLACVPSDYEVHVFGLDYIGFPHDLPYRLYPIIDKETLGQKDLLNIVNVVQPTHIFFLQDPWWIGNYLRELKETIVTNKIKVGCYYPVDSEYNIGNWFEHFDLMDSIITYTEFGKEQTLKSCKRTFGDAVDLSKKVNVVPHGVDKETFHHLPIEEVKKAFSAGIPDDAIIILNSNRNQERKALWRTIEGFIQALYNNPQKPMYLWMNTKTTGPFFIDEMDVKTYFEALVQQRFEPELATKMKERLIISIVGEHGYSDAELNYVYNRCQIGINTASAEGWGLVSCEHALTGAYQILPDNSVFPEIWASEELNCGFMDCDQEILEYHLFARRYLPTIEEVSSAITLAVRLVEENEANNTEDQWRSIAAKNAYATFHSWEEVAKDFWCHVAQAWGKSQPSSTISDANYIHNWISQLSAHHAAQESKVSN